MGSIDVAYNDLLAITADDEIVIEIREDLRLLSSNDVIVDGVQSTVILVNIRFLNVVGVSRRHRGHGGMLLVLEVIERGSWKVFRVDIVKEQNRIARHRGRKNEKMRFSRSVQNHIRLQFRLVNVFLVVLLISHCHRHQVLVFLLDLSRIGIIPNLAEVEVDIGASGHHGKRSQLGQRRGKRVAFRLRLRFIKRRSISRLTSGDRGGIGLLGGHQIAKVGQSEVLRDPILAINDYVGPGCFSTVRLWENKS